MRSAGLDVSGPHLDQPRVDALDNFRVLADQQVALRPLQVRDGTEENSDLIKKWNEILTRGGVEDRMLVVRMKYCSAPPSTIV